MCQFFIHRALESLNTLSNTAIKQWYCNYLMNTLQINIIQPAPCPVSGCCSKFSPARSPHPHKQFRLHPHNKSCIEDLLTSQGLAEKHSKQTLLSHSTLLQGQIRQSINCILATCLGCSPFKTDVEIEFQHRVAEPVS